VIWGGGHLATENAGAEMADTSICSDQGRERGVVAIAGKFPQDGIMRSNGKMGVGHHLPKSDTLLNFLKIKAMYDIELVEPKLAIKEFLNRIILSFVPLEVLGAMSIGLHPCNQGEV
jgi:hypothetical protein